MERKDPSTYGGAPITCRGRSVHCKPALLSGNVHLHLHNVRRDDDVYTSAE